MSYKKKKTFVTAILLEIVKLLEVMIHNRKIQWA